MVTGARPLIPADLETLYRLIVNCVDPALPGVEVKRQVLELLRDFRERPAAINKGDRAPDEFWEDYDTDLPLRSCGRMREPHRAHPWDHPNEGRVHCWGQNPLPADAVQRYCTPGCRCAGHCARIRKGQLPRLIMCTKRWSALPPRERIEITESVEG